MVNGQEKNKGFILITLIIALAIIAIWAAIYFGKSGGGQANIIQTGNKAIEQTKQNNALQNQGQIEIQNQLNSIDR